MSTPQFQFLDYNRTVVGFHGTSAEQADRLVAGDAFRDSDRDNEWFGKGVYFWEYAPKQAWRWARAVRKHDRPAVVGAMIRLGNCLDLLDPENVTVLKAYHREVIDSFHQAGEPTPVNHRKHKRLDCAVFNVLYDRLELIGQPLDSARAVYVPTDSTKRVWKGSWIHDDAHIQICVRNQANIQAVWHVREDGRYGKEA